MSRKKYRKTESGAKQIRRDASAQSFALLLHRHIPPFVIERLRPMKEKLRNRMQGLTEAERAALREEISSATPSNAEDWEDWSNQFLAVFAQKDEPGFVDSLKQVPDPPPESSGLWSRLIMQAEKAGDEGIAACLVLYTLGCARAVRELRAGRHASDDEPHPA
jgi:hypothetical protein